jgi:UDP-N-acetylglucosamine 1-carboxyvinyltransferase
MNLLDRLDTTLRVHGGARLEGSVETHGAKNAALPIMAAALMARGKVTLHRVPRISDVSVMWSLLEALGARLSLEGPNTITIDASNVATYRAPWTLVRKLAASFDVVGPLLGRFGRAEVSLPGGCILGTRATDMHEMAMRALGATVTNEHGYLVAQAAGKRLCGADIEFRTPSVGATKNAMLSAVLARGTTTIRNAAMEPEVVDVANV